MADRTGTTPTRLDFLKQTGRATRSCYWPRRPMVARIATHRAPMAPGIWSCHAERARYLRICSKALGERQPASNAFLARRLLFPRGGRLARMSAILPRFIRLRDAPGYLGMDRNRFNREVRPQLTVVPI